MRSDIAKNSFIHTENAIITKQNFLCYSEQVYNIQI